MGKAVVLDLEDVDYCDSSGFGALLDCRSRVKSSGGDLRLCGMEPSVERLFGLMGLRHVFPAYRDLDSALDAVKV
jgi:anti-anti-sigma factor